MHVRTLRHGVASPPRSENCPTPTRLCCEHNEGASRGGKREGAPVECMMAFVTGSKERRGQSCERRTRRFSSRPSPMRRSTCELHFLTRARPKLCEGPPHIYLPPFLILCIHGQFTRRRWRLGNHRILREGCEKPLYLKLYMIFAQVSPRDTETPERRGGGSA